MGEQDMRGRTSLRPVWFLGGLLGLMVLGSLLSAVAGPLVDRVDAPGSRAGGRPPFRSEPAAEAAPVPEAPEATDAPIPPADPAEALWSPMPAAPPDGPAARAARERAQAYRLREEHQALAEELRAASGGAGGEEVTVPWVRMLSGFLVVVAVICLGVFLLKRLNGGAALSRGRYLGIIESRPVGRKMHLYLVRVAGRVVLIAAHGDHATTVTEFAEEELPALQERPGASGAGGFGDLLKRWLTPPHTATSRSGDERCGSDSSV